MWVNGDELTVPSLRGANVDNISKILARRYYWGALLLGGIKKHSISGGWGITIGPKRNQPITTWRATYWF